MNAPDEQTPVVPVRPRLQGSLERTEAENEALASRCEDADPYTRLTALRALAESDPERALPLLQRLGRSDPEATLRHFARARAEAIEEQVRALEGEHLPSSLVGEVRHRQLVRRAFLMHGLLLILIGSLGALGFLPPMPTRTLSVIGIRFLYDVPLVQFALGCLCLFASFTVSDGRSIETWLAQRAASVAICVTGPLGPLVGPWLLYNLSASGTANRRSL